MYKIQIFFKEGNPLILFINNKDNVNRMTTQIEVEGNKIFDDINRNNVNRGNTVVKNRKAY